MRRWRVPIGWLLWKRRLRAALRAQWNLRRRMPPLRLSRRAAALLLTTLGSGCSHTYPCPDSCAESVGARFVLSCRPAEPPQVMASGACSGADATASESLANPVGSWVQIAGDSVNVFSPAAGACSVMLTFATGFTYSQDVTFTSESTPLPPGCECWQHTVPATASFAVDNPPETCADADAGDASFDAAHDGLD